MYNISVSTYRKFSSLFLRPCLMALSHDLAKPGTCRTVVPVIFALMLGLLNINSSFAQTKTAKLPVKQVANEKVVTNGFSFSVEPKPAWVAEVRPEPQVSGVRAPMHYALIDEQMNLERQNQSLYRHVIRVIDESAGLSPGAEIQAAFDPSYQTFILHKIEIIRDGHRLNKLDRKKVQLLQRETQLEYKIYDGRVTASIVLDDVRVGDQIEYSYSVRGMNPVFEGKFIDTEQSVAELGPLSLYQFRLLAPENRQIQYRTGADIHVDSNIRDGVRETIFRRTAIPQFQSDQNAPESAYLDDLIQLSEFSSWAEVSQWGEKLFAPAYIDSAEVKQRADEIRKKANSPSEKLLAALDLVQTEIRYFGMEIGPNSHLPVTPQTVLKQRFGDCKDKTALLIALLKALDIPASPVLVSTHYRDVIDTMLPSPLDFDHAITRVELDGKTYWLDGTRAYQKGGLADRQSTGLKKGLVIAGGTQALASIPDSFEELRIAVEDRFKVNKFSEDPELESRITYYGELAEFLRSAIASRTTDRIETQFVAQYVRLYPKIKATQAMRIEDAQDKNTVTLIQQFTLPEFWRYPEQRTLAADVGFWNMADAVSYPNESNRKLPFAIQSPGIYRHTVTFDFPEDVLKGENNSKFSDGNSYLDYRVSYNSSARHALISAEMQFRKDKVLPIDWPSYTDKLVKLRPRFASTITIPPISSSQLEKLNVELREADQNVRKGKDGYKFYTSVQMTSKAIQLALTAQLESGRLNPKFRAQALSKRGVQFDNMGQLNAAAKDFEEALSLTKDDADIYQDAAINAFALGQDALAVQRLAQAIKLQPSDSNPAKLGIYTDYFGKNYLNAKQSLLEALKRSDEVDSSYSAIWLYLTARHNGENGAEVIKNYMPSSSKPRWPYPILQIFAGNGDFETALKIAQEGDKDPSKLCELYFYMGEKYLLDGEKKRAKEFFQKSVDTRVFEFNEYMMSKRRIDSALDI